MKIKLIAMPSRTKGLKEESTRIVRLKVSGPVDPTSDVLVRARQMVVNTGSTAMIESFDWAVKNGGFFGKKPSIASSGSRSKTRFTGPIKCIRSK